MKFSLVNLGCKVNRVEADSVAASLLAAGWNAVHDNADIVVVNTCTVTAEADRKTRKEVNRALTRNPSAVVMVTGCAANMDPAAYEALSERVRIVEKAHVVNECLAFAGQEYSHAPALLRMGSAFPTRVGIKVQDGCDNACTFCIVHVARGRAYSVPVETCVQEARAYAEAGVREIVLTGIDLGAYSYEGATLVDLVKRLRKEAPRARLRISSIEPHTITDELIDLLASQDGMVCRHIHLPLQSGSSKVLREMARHYSAEYYLQIVAKLRNAVPSIALSTDVIVGFPGETESDFQATVHVAQECGFSRMHLFRYSKRAGTPAAARSDQIAPEIAAARMNELEGVARSLRLQDAAGRIGTTERILVESKGRGMTESYYEVSLPPTAQQGQLLSEVLKNYSEKDGTFSL